MAERPILYEKPIHEADIEYLGRNSKNIAIASEFAKWAHQGQFRKTGEPFYEHPRTVANILISWGIKPINPQNEALLAAALLHDTKEDNPAVRFDDIKRLFGEEAIEFGADVAHLVDGVSKFTKETGEEGTDQDTQRKVVDRSYLDPRIAVIKLADRYHNMLTLEGLKPEKQIEKGYETLEVYTFLAKKLGLWVLKSALEDLSFAKVDPDLYSKVLKDIDTDPRVNPYYLENVRSLLEEMRCESSLGGRVDVRLNGYWNLNEKRKRTARSLKNSSTSFKSINDVVSFRVCLATRRDCYQYLGLVREHFGDEIDFARHDDFIASPAPNHYMAIQDTVNTPDGPIEIAIMTQDMEQFNNWGVVSELAKGVTDLSDYALKMVKANGSNRFLPPKGTGIDLAYAVSDEVGATAHHVVIDSVVHPLSVVVPNASTAEIISDFSQIAPPEALLHYALPETKKKMLAQREYPVKQEKIREGKELIEKLLLKRGLIDLVDLSDIEEYSPKISRLLMKLDCADGLDSVYFKLGVSYESKEHLEKVLDEEGITKESLGLTSIRVRGNDQPGVLDHLTGIISDINGNIINTRVRMAKGRYQLRLVLENLDQEKEELLKNRLQEDPLFEEILIA